MRMDDALRVLRAMRDPDDDADELPEDAPDIFPGDVDNGLEVPGQPDEEPDYDDEDVEDWEPDTDPDDESFDRPMGLPVVKLPEPDLSDTDDTDDDDGTDDDEDEDEDGTDDDVGGGGWDQGPGTWDPDTAGGRGYCPLCGDEHENPDAGDCPGVEVRAAPFEYRRPHTLGPLERR